MKTKFGKPQLKILYLSQYFFPETFLGNEVAKALVDRGHDVTAVAAVPNYPEGSFYPGFSNKLRRADVWFGVKIARAWTVRRGNSRLRLLLNYLVYPLTASTEVVRLSKQRVDVSFVFMPSPIFQGLVGLFAKYMFGVPTAFWVQDIWPDSAVVTLGIKNRLTKVLLDATCSFIYRKADMLMVQSSAFIPRLEQLGVDSSRITVVPNMAPAGFDRVEREHINPGVRGLVPTGRFVIMFAGNIGASQDFDTILAAASILRASRNILWVIVGAGRDEARVRRLVSLSELDDQVLFLGRHSIDLMPSFFACADVMLLSLKANELFDMTVPSKLQSYLACGRPLVASLGGEGARIILEAGAGIAVPPSDPAKLAAAVRSLSELPREELSKMGASGYQYAQQFYNVDVIFNRIEDLLVSIARVQRSDDE